MGRKKLDLKERNSRLALQIEKYFRAIRKEPLTFGRILDKYAKTGESCDQVAERLSEMTGGAIKISHSTFGYAVRLVIKQKKTHYRIKSMWRDNPLRRPGSGRPASSASIEKRKQIIRLRLDGRTQADIARELGISKQSVSQILIDFKKSLDES